MKPLQNIKLITDRLREKELCPSILNISFKGYSFLHFFNDIFAGLKAFFAVIPLAISFAIFSGGSPIQGVTTVGIASIVSMFLGGAKYQINSVAWMLSFVSIDIFTKYQYKGMLLTAFIVSIVLILYGRILLGNLLKYVGYTFLVAIAVYIALVIIITQTQVLLNIPIVYSCQNLWGNCITLFSGLKYIETSSLYTYLVFMGSFVVLKIFFKGFSVYMAYLMFWEIIMWCNIWDIFPIPEMFASLKTIGQSFFQDLDKNTIFTAANLLTFSKNMYADLILSSFSIILILSCQICSSLSISKNLTGDSSIQTNMELISTGIANFLSIAAGGLFVSPDTNLTVQNIANKSKSIITLLVVATAAWGIIQIKDYFFEYIPIFAISTILIYAGINILKQYLSLKYFVPITSETQLFFLILSVAIIFGFIPATFVGFTISLMRFVNRMIDLKTPSVRTTQNHDLVVIEFLKSKYGYATDKRFPNKIIKKIEVIQFDDILQINLIKQIADIFISRRSFPSIVVIYFKNIPFFDSYVFDALKTFVEIAKKHSCLVIITGTNGLLLKILDQKSKEYNSENVFGYVVPNFAEAIKRISHSLKVKTPKLKKSS